MKRQLHRQCWYLRVARRSLLPCHRAAAPEVVVDQRADEAEHEEAECS
jgi:hypothetical protein